MVEGEHGPREDDGDGVVEHALAEDDGEDVLSHPDGLEDGEDAHRVGGADDGAEEERGEARERVADAELAGREDEAAHGGAGDDGAHEGEQDRGHDARDEGRDVQVESRREDDRRQQPHHEELGAECVVAQHLVVVRELGESSAGNACDDTHRRLRDAMYVPALELVADGNGRGNGKNAHEECPAEVSLLACKLLPGRVLSAERRRSIFHHTVAGR